MKKQIFLSLSFIFSPVSGSGQEKLFDELLISEIGAIEPNTLPLSWVFSNEGGVIRYAELDIVGDDRKEIFYERTTSGNIHKTEKIIEVYFQSESNESPIKIEGDISLSGFYKKEGDKSLFLKATEGLNFDTPEEKAFTRKLTIQEVSPDGVEYKTHIIDDDTGKEILELWESTLSSYDKRHIDLMKGRGFSKVNPTFQWASVKDYLSGDFEWKNYDVNAWSSLNEFSIEARTWSVHNKVITPEYLEISRSVRALQDKEELFVSYNKVILPDGYLTPDLAYKALLKKSSEKGNGASSIKRKGAVDATKENQNPKSVIESTQSSSSKFLLWSIAGIVVVSLFTFLFMFWKRSSRN
jgi:hypothetical protein